MSSVINVSGLTLNPKENPDFATFIFERVFNTPQLTQLHTVWDGVKMKEQIVFAGRMSKVGIKDSTAGCTRPNSGASAALTQKYWEPLRVGDTLVHCQADVNALFKAYYSKIQKYSELFEIQGTDEEKFLMILFENAIKEAILRLVWFGDPAVAQSAAGTPGVVLAADVKFYDSVIGLWKRIFTAVAGAEVKRYTITENANITIPLQMTLAAGRSVAIFEEMWSLADSRLKAAENKILPVNNNLFENYRKYLQSKGENFSLEYTMEGFSMLRWQGIPVIDMGNLWDLWLFADFEDNSTNNAYYLPNRAILTVPENIPIATLNSGDFEELESWYNKDERTSKQAFGLTLDTQIIEGYMAVVAY